MYTVVSDYSDDIYMAMNYNNYWEIFDQITYSFVLGRANITF